MNDNAEAADALQQYREMEVRRRALSAPRFPALQAGPGAEPWRPVMTEQQRKEHEQYVKEHELPF